MYQNEELFIPCDGIDVHAKITFPKKQAEKMPVLILFPGFTGHIEEDHIIAVAETANEQGYVCLRAELYGHGKSGGRFFDHNIMLWMHEAMRVVDYAEALPYAGDLILSGHSQGGLTTVLAGGLVRDKLKALMPLSPATSIYYGANEGELLGMAFDPDNLPEVLETPSLRLSSDYVRAARMVPYEAAIKAFNKPVYIVHSEADDCIPYEYAVRLAKDYKNATLKTVHGADHCFTGHLADLKAAVRAFLVPAGHAGDGEF